MKTILDFVTLHTQDLKATRAFYTDVLGFEVVEERPNGNAFVQASGAGLAIREDKTLIGKHGGDVSVSFIVPNADTYHQRLSERGVEIIQPPQNGPFGKMFIVCTPDGHQLSFREP